MDICPKIKPNNTTCIYPTIGWFHCNSLYFLSIYLGWDIFPICLKLASHL